MNISLAIKPRNSRYYSCIESNTKRWIENDIHIENWIKSKSQIEKWDSAIYYNHGVLYYNNLSLCWFMHTVDLAGWPDENFDIPDSEVADEHYFIFMLLPIEHLNNVLDQLRLMQVNVFKTINVDFQSRKRAPAADKMIKIVEIVPNIYHIARHGKCLKDLHMDILCDHVSQSDIIKTHEFSLSTDSENAWVFFTMCSKTGGLLVYNKKLWELMQEL